MDKEHKQRPDTAKSREALEEGLFGGGEGLLLGAALSLISRPDVPARPLPLIKLTFVGGTLGAITCGAGAYLFKKFKMATPVDKNWADGKIQR